MLAIKPCHCLLHVTAHIIYTMHVCGWTDGCIVIHHARAFIWCNKNHSFLSAHFFFIWAGHLITSTCTSSYNMFMTITCSRLPLSCWIVIRPTNPLKHYMEDYWHTTTHMLRIRSGVFGDPTVLLPPHVLHLRGLLRTAHLKSSFQQGLRKSILRNTP